MKTVIIIPARYDSTRYPGKPLVALRQPDGTDKSLIQMSWEAANKIAGVAEIYVATDDTRIQAAAEAFGASVIMTDRSCENGTARCADALERANITADLVINFQGDAPLTPHWFVEDLIQAMHDDPHAHAATPVLQCDRQTYGHFIEDRKNGRVGATTAVFNRNQDALYFTKEIIPYIAPDRIPEGSIPVYHHVGVYAYRPAALRDYIAWGESDLENHEGLEQLRFLVNEKRVKCVVVEARGRVFWELNNPVDVERIETVLRQG